LIAALCSGAAWTAEVVIEKFIRHTRLAVGLMVFEKFIRYTGLAVGLKPSAMGCEACRRGRERRNCSKTIDPRFIMPR